MTTDSQPSAEALAALERIRVLAKANRRRFVDRKFDAKREKQISEKSFSQLPPSDR